jgi:membrane protein DedA with SNARE-associated domain
MGLGAAAFPLAPFLYRRHYVILVLLRPTRLVLFFGGVLARRHLVDPWVVVAAAAPLGLFGVWQAYALGLAHKSQISSGRIPRLSKRLLPPRRIQRVQRALRKQGTKLIILARMGTFPSYFIGTAAGSSGMDAKRFFLADGVGVILEISLSLSLGYAAGGGGGRAILIGVGVGSVVVGGIVYGRQIHRR